jgi:hypothetical protein
MSYEEILKTSDDGRFRVRLISDEYASEPDDDGQSPLLRLEYRNGWTAEHVMATGRPLDDDARIEEAASRWGYGQDRHCFEKYLRAYYGTREIEVWCSQDYTYITYDTARWRAYIGFEEGAGTPQPLVNMDEYKAWCNGDCWFYVVERSVTWHRDDDPDVTMATWEPVEDCGGFYGDYGREAALEAFGAVLAEEARPKCGTPMRHPDKSVSPCVLDKDHYITVEDSPHQDEHGHTAPVLVSQATIREVAHVSREWPDGVHTCAELQKLEPGRRPCTCGRCPSRDTDALLTEFENRGE